jgi:pantetheine-phosphate adenylyltransferase
MGVVIGGVIRRVFGRTLAEGGLFFWHGKSYDRGVQVVALFLEFLVMSRRAVYTGSFDPITLGHLNVIERSSRLVDELVVGVGSNIEKLPLFSADQRVALVKQATSHLENVVVRRFEGLAVHFVRELGARVIIRGVRTLTDIEAEFTMTLANRKLDPEIETVFLMADDEYSHVSSSLIKQITPLADDAELAQFVPASVIGPLRAVLPTPGETL